MNGASIFAMRWYGFGRTGSAQLWQLKYENVGFINKQIRTGAGTSTRLSQRLMANLTTCDGLQITKEKCWNSFSPNVETVGLHWLF
tara:strand:- start:12 stop:269 length:258 start_codon:yes stop_codon:yes gene_type:complete